MAGRRNLTTNAISAVAVVVNHKQTNTFLFDDHGDLPCDVLFQIIEHMSNDQIPKCKAYYEDVIPAMSISTFRSHFRVRPATFEIILSELAPHPEFTKRDPERGGRSQVNPEKCLLIALWVLATPESYRSIGDRFDVSKSTVLYCLNVVVICVNRYLTASCIRWSKPEEKLQVSQTFGKYGMPNILGVIDGSHIPIKKPQDNGMDYFNRKNFYSLVLQGVVKCNLQFTNVDIRWPGSVHDARVFRTSDIYLIGQDLCEPPYYIIGDSAYPLLQWVITPFRNNGHLDQRQRYFNKVLAKTRVVVENAFALLKGRFRRLKDLFDRTHVQDICDTVVACCALHNFCLMKEDDDIQNFIDEGREERLPMEHGPVNYDEREGHIIRNNLVNIIWNNRHI